jgi:hypothetical protein
MALLASAVLAQQQSSPPSQSSAPQTSQQDQTKNPAAGQSGTADSTAGKTATKPAGMAEMKTQTYKGTLIDASCAMRQATSGAAMTSSADSAPAAASTDASATEKAPETPKANSADRAAGDPKSCTVSSSTNQLGLKLDDGRTLRFDLVGNQRAQDELKANKKWTEAAASNKPIHAKVDGAVSGDKLIVSSIH